MGAKDITEKHLEEYSDVFADIVNVLLFHGDQIVHPDSLVDTGQRKQYKADSGKIHEHERDISKFWKDGKTFISLIGLENQTSIDRDMVLRVIGYDGVSYRSQLNGKGNQRYPVSTLVLYYGDQVWEPKSLKESLTIPAILDPWVQDYRINLFPIAFLTPEQVNMFQSDFRAVADYFVQTRTNDEYIPSPQTLKHVDEVMKLMEVMADDKDFGKVMETAKAEGKKVSNMSEALRIMKNQAIAEGIEQNKKETAKTLMLMGSDNDFISKVTGLSLSEIEKLREKK